MSVAIPNAPVITGDAFDIPVQTYLGSLQREYLLPGTSQDPEDTNAALTLVYEILLAADDTVVRASAPVGVLTPAFTISLTSADTSQFTGVHKIIITGTYDTPAAETITGTITYTVADA